MQPAYVGPLLSEFESSSIQYRNADIHVVYNHFQVSTSASMVWQLDRTQQVIFQGEHLSTVAAMRSALWIQHYQGGMQLQGMNHTRFVL